MKQAFKQLQIIHAALLIGSLLFFLVASFLGDFQYTQDMNISDIILVYIVMGFIPICIGMSMYMNKQFFSEFNDNGDLNAKMGNYGKRIIVRSALIEGATLFAAVVVLLTTHLFAALAFVIGWFALVSVRPTLNEFARDYKLTSQEEHDMHKD